MSRFRSTKLVIIIILVSVIAFSVGYLVKDTSSPTTETVLDEHAEHGLESKVDESGNIIWTCSMHPQIQLPEPGNCPICFMELIPLEKKDTSEQTSLREIELSESARKLAGIVTEPVQRLDVNVEIRMVGKVDYDETRVRAITAWTGGRVDKIYVDYTGGLVKKGQPMVSIYSPELLTAQAELIESIRTLRDLKDSKLEIVKNTAKRTEEAAREKLRLLGLKKSQVDRVVRDGKASDHITLYAPQGGVILAKNVNEGQYVKTGASIYSIADLSSLWVMLEAYESDLPWIELGQQIEFQTEAYPGKTFKGKVVYIDPIVTEKTRTVRVRLEVPNKDGSLKPGMLVRASQKKGGDSKQQTELPLVIPASAPLLTGKRAIVYVVDPDNPGKYEGREIVLGAKANNYYIVRSGLEESDEVVTKGNFKIDSAVQIVAKPSMMNPATSTTPVEDELPPLFLSKIRLLDATFQSLATEVATAELAKTHLAFGQFNKELRLIDGSSLTGESALRWREYSMLLSNDAMIGAEAPNEKRLNEIFAEMERHYATLRSAFKLDAPAAELTAPEEFKKQLGVVFAEYEPMSEALAADNLQAAKLAAIQVAAALQKVDMSILNGPAHNVWMPALKKINDGLEAVNEAEDIVAVRAGFEPISVGLSEAILKLGVETSGPLYEIFCPMAFDYEGATWLQRDESVRNPYMGSAMLTCGETNQQLKQ
nr:efflux RND transporter periplasmic adaptor subunit [Pseudodesulfovibrio sp.]